MVKSQDEVLTSFYFLLEKHVLVKMKYLGLVLTVLLISASKAWLQFSFIRH